MQFKTRHAVLYAAIISLAVLMTSFSPKPPETAYNSKELLNNVLSAIANTKTLRYNLICDERINGKMLHTESKVKLQVSPRKLYLFLNGPEVLYLQGLNNGNALVNPAAFPYINLNLDPYGSLMRKDQHHTINEMGLQYLSDIIKDGIRRAGDKLDKYFVIIGEEKLNGRLCYKLSIAFPDFAWKPYTVKKDEDITAIARKHCASEYMILENNPKAAWYTDVKEGEIIQVPDAYAKLTLLFVDKEFLLPVSSKVYDDKGLFETYEYQNLQVNPTIAPEEFTKDYKDYKF